MNTFWKKILKGVAVIAVALTLGLLLIAGTTGFDDIALTGWLTTTTHAAIGTYETVGTYLSVGTYALTGSYLKAGTYVQATSEFRAPAYKLAMGATSRMDSLGRVTMPVRNKNGAAISAGLIVELDTMPVLMGTLIKKDGATTRTDSLVLDSISATEGVPVAVNLVGFGTPTGDTVKIFGTALTGAQTQAAKTDTIAFGTTATDIRYSKYLWMSIDSINIRDVGGTGSDSTQIYVTSAGGVIQSGAASTRPLGVVITTTIADNAVGEVCVYGPALVKAKAASGAFLRPGYPVYCGAGGDALQLPLARWAIDSLAVNGVPFGYCLGAKDDVSDTANVWVFVKPK